ncbi:SDR family oxidoreductase [Bradyrhizobium sp. LCT2]|uniref:SDR family oxidoreductase n=1 Tax=Bradyrhizobium sp. LCT2 TaxID=2493093 RepID=UPI001FEDC994|nr:SDR family oxidoreductase [Bradyrhizobium sp. LCT2]
MPIVRTPTARPCSPPPPLRWKRWREVWCWNWRRAASTPCLPAPPIRPCSRTLGEGRDAYVAALKEKLPLRRLGTPEEVGAAMVFLMINGFMNGETFHIDGGSRLV